MRLITKFTGEQNLILHKINLYTNEIEVEDSIGCIHTAVTNISTKSFVNYQNDSETQEYMDKKFIEIRSSEGLRDSKIFT